MSLGNSTLFFFFQFQRLATRQAQLRIKLQ